jgi:biotin transport system substrate-specific component
MKTKENATVQNGNTKVKELVLIGLMSAVICILGPLSVTIPISPVPISMTNLAIYFVLYVLGAKRGCISYLIYLLIGFVGVPVFSAFSAGPAKLLGPTGGYLIGFIFMALVAGFFIDKYPYHMGMCLLGMVIGTVICYIFGTVWLSWQAKMQLPAAFMAGVVPFLPGDVCKMVLAMLAGPQIRKRLQKAGLN